MEYLGANKPVNQREPLVSVCVTTYQHSDYIRRCLDGILNQDVDFLFEIIIGEDGSTDGTREICKEYAEKYPDVIRLFLRSRDDVIYINSKPTGRFNYLANMKSARGKYVAICDGDDYWYHSRKISNQVCFLEKETTYVGVAHNTLIQKGRTIKIARPRRSFNIGTNELLNGNPIPAPSIMYRKDALPTFDEKIYLEAPMGDWPTHLFASFRGKIRFLWNYWSVYRKGVGIYSKLSEITKLESKVLSRQLALEYLSAYERNLCLEVIDKTKNQIQNLKGREAF